MDQVGSLQSREAELDGAGSTPTSDDNDFERLKLLFDYTKFHIALYATLVTLLIALVSLLSDQVHWVQRLALLLTTFCFVAAGACGGIVAANIPYISGMQDFIGGDGQNRGMQIGPRWPVVREWRLLGFTTKPTAPGSTWATLEHLFSWAGILFALLGLVLGFLLSLASKPAHSVPF